MTRSERFVRLLCIAALCALALPSLAFADQTRGVDGDLPAGHVVEPAQPPSLGTVLQEMPRDLWRFISLDSALVLAAGGGAALITHVWDDDFAEELEVNTRLNDAFEPGSKYGAFAIVLGGSFAVYGAGVASGHRHLAVVGADLVRAQMVSQLWVQALKYTVQRERPDQSNDVSFPSGHAAGGFAAASVVARHYGWKAAIPAYIGAGYIAAARVHDNKHFLSDVTFGAAMGIAGARTVMLKAGRYAIQVAPAPSRGGVALGFAVVPIRQSIGR